ncbi:hypothetical protein SSTU70S_03459 [Stutzerimonas stutzeri]
MDQEFGQTLGVWGLGNGPYVVLPLLGPSTVRDTAGLVPDAFLKPYPYMDHVPSRNVTRGVDVVDTRAGLLSAEKMITGDKYVFMPQCLPAEPRIPYARRPGRRRLLNLAAGSLKSGIKA